ncbi:MAG: hypothetical protein O7B35_12115 [Deltaproteobacteria bacterium]|nr:hypothetical protein [Deltaproteobacteria bacterium]
MRGISRFSRSGSPSPCQHRRRNVREDSSASYRKISDGNVLEAFGPHPLPALSFLKWWVILLFQYQGDCVGRLRTVHKLEILHGALGQEEGKYLALIGGVHPGILSLLLASLLRTPPPNLSLIRPRTLPRCHTQSHKKIGRLI